MTARKRRKAGKATNPVKTMADYAMSFDRLGLWMAERAKSTSLRHPQATSLSMLDGAVASVVAGPASMNPEEWVCPLLGLGPDAFNHYTEEFSAGPVATCVGIGWRVFGRHEANRSCGEVNDLIVWFLGEGVPSVDLAHGDLTRGEERPEQHGGGFGAGQDSLGLYPALEFFVQSLDRVRGSDRLPLARREPRECEQLVARFLQAVGDGAAFEAPLADERLAPGLDLAARRGVDHVAVVVRDFLV